MSSAAAPEVPLRAVLVGVQLPDTTPEDVAASLDELSRLARTLGFAPVGRLVQARPGLGSPALLGSGKLRELGRLTGGSGRVPSGAAKRQTGARPSEEDDAAPEPEDEDGGLEEAGAEGLDGEPAQAVLVDHDLTPSQLRNLEAATGVDVLDRSSVILSIFQRHARTREAKLQVEIARLKYLAPRLRETGRTGDRQRGGGWGRGAGESNLEVDRRKVRDRIAELSAELESVQREEDTRRARRVRWDTVALVGYTNAGKSSLMRALTGSDVLVADQLFATLDTTIRALHPETRPRLLVSDTVGFIKKLPHDLVASFRSTLEEAREAALLLHVVDASDPAWPSHVEVTQTVLGEIGAGDRPSLLVLNKADRLDPAERARLAEEHPEAFIGSAVRPDDVAALRRRIVAFFESFMVEDDVFVPYAEQRRVHEVHESCRVLGETHDETGTRLRVLAPPELIARLRAS